MRSRVQGWSPTTISEYSFGLGLTVELVDRLGGMSRLIAAPLVPSLQQEADLGFDLALQARWLLLCLQFKIPTRLVRRTAAEASVFGVPYFRFHVKTDATRNGRCQHNTLCDLQQSLSSVGEHVLYASPLFDKPQELTLHARAGTLVDHSVFAAPMRLGHVTPGDKHCFAFRSQRDMRPFSEPGLPFDASFSTVLEMALSTASDRQAAGDFLHSCDAKLAEAASAPQALDEPVGTTTSMEALSLDLQPILIGVDVNL